MDIDLRIIIAFVVNCSCTMLTVADIEVKITIEEQSHYCNIPGFIIEDSFREHLYKDLHHQLTWVRNSLKNYKKTIRDAVIVGVDTC